MQKPVLRPMKWFEIPPPRWTPQFIHNREGVPVHVMSSSGGLHLIASTPGLQSVAHPKNRFAFRENHRKMSNKILITAFANLPQVRFAGGNSQKRTLATNFWLLKMFP